MQTDYWLKQANTSSKAKSYFVQHGFLGGSLHSRGLEQALKSSGYISSKSITTADIVIVHSAGYCLLPQAISPAIVVLAAPALPRKNKRPTYVEANKQIWKSARQDNYLLKRMMWSLFSFYYGFRHPFISRKIATVAGDPSFSLPSFRHSNVIFIANKDDPWPRGPQLKKLLTSKPWTFISLPGSHEYIWENPSAYVEILNRYAK